MPTERVSFEKQMWLSELDNLTRAAIEGMSSAELIQFQATASCPHKSIEPSIASELYMRVGAVLTHDELSLTQARLACSLVSPRCLIQLAGTQALPAELEFKKPEVVAAAIIASLAGYGRPTQTEAEAYDAISVLLSDKPHLAIFRSALESAPRPDSRKLIEFSLIRRVKLKSSPQEVLTLLPAQAVLSNSNWKPLVSNTKHEAAMIIYARRCLSSQLAKIEAETSDAVLALIHSFDGSFEDLLDQAFAITS